LRLTIALRKLFGTDDDRVQPPASREARMNNLHRNYN